MQIFSYPLWTAQPQGPAIHAFVPEKQSANYAVVILAGGAYCFRAEHEGKGYAEFFAENGILSFVVDYRHHPDKFPIPLMDARRAVQFARYNATKFGIDPNKIAIMGSSAGGHLAALTSVYHNPHTPDVPDAIDSISHRPNAQILCYPVIKLLGKGVAHLNSGRNLLGELQAEMGEELSPDLIATSDAPAAFIWHTFEDGAVHVQNSLDYVKRLKECGVATELHVFPYGYHGLGLCKGEDETSRYNAKWTTLLLDWLSVNAFKQ